MTPGVLMLALRIAAAMALCAFLAAVLWQLSREVRLLSMPALDFARASLITSEGKAVPLRMLNLIGRAVDNDVVLEDETVSAHHARLSFQAGQWWLEDLGSRNGTTVNGVELHGPLVVTYGDEIRFGSVLLRFDVAELSPAEPVSEAT